MNTRGQQPHSRILIFPMKLPFIALFGVLGVMSRYFVSLGVERYCSQAYPYGTFSINILGSFLIGMVYVLGVERMSISEDLRIALMVGFLGGFTTFSSYSLEVVKLIEKRDIGVALFYSILSPVIAFGATTFGMYLCRRISS
jgi:CrcB protein